MQMSRAVFKSAASAISAMLPPVIIRDLGFLGRCVLRVAADRCGSKTPPVDASTNGGVGVGWSGLQRTDASAQGVGVQVQIALH